MNLFTTQINSIQSQIEALQAERNRLQDLGDAVSEHIKGLDTAIKIAKDEGALDAITQLKSAVMSLFPGEQKPDIPPDSYAMLIFHPKEEKEMGLQAKNEVDAIAAFDKACLECDYPLTLVSKANGVIKSYDPEDYVDPSELAPEFGTPEKPCPATTTGECLNLECEGETFICEGCGKETPYCFGGDGDELCNDCYSQNPPPDPETDDLTKEKIQYIKELQENQSQAEEEKIDPKFKRMFDGEPEPDDFNLVVYNDRVHRYENQIGIHFKLKREAKAWADQFEVKYHDCKIEIHKDDFESFGYLLKMTKGNPDDPQWWQEVTSFDYSKSPAENRQREKYHVLIQKNNESETVEIESSDEAIARKNYQHLVESIPYAYIHLMSNKRGCVESHKPAVQRCDPADSQSAKERAPREQALPKIEPLPSDVMDEEIETPAFSFMATGMGWLNVTHDGEVLGVIYSNPSGWELENGDQFETREEAAQALFNQPPSAV